MAILVADGFEQVELEKPQEALEKAGAETDIVSPSGDEVQGWQHDEEGDASRSMCRWTRRSRTIMTPCCCRAA